VTSANRAAAGRYEKKTVASAYASPLLGQIKPSLRARTAIAAVPDAVERGKFAALPVNRLVDLLEMEHSRDLIDIAAYAAGRRVQGIFEKRRGPGGSNWLGGDRVDATMAKEIATVNALEVANQINALRGELVRRLGQFDAQIVEWVIGDGKSYKGVAALTGPLSDRRVFYVAQRFRDALGQLADAWAATGVSPKPDNA
jgi:hypothetical protein